MIHKLKNSQWLQDLQRFMENFDAPPSLELEYFHPMQLPVVITEASVQMRTVQDYSVLSLLILRLFDAGIRDPLAIQSISGMSLQTVNAYIEKEKFLLEHIDRKTEQLTQLGRLTLEANQNLQGRAAKSHQLYNCVIRIHIDPLTASLIPQYLEREWGDNITPNEEAGDFILPRKDAPTDETFLEELNTRLLTDINARMDEHVYCDTVKNGDVLSSVNKLCPIRVFYRWGYLAKFRGMRYPMVVYSGKRSVTNVNADSVARGVQSTFVMMPIALSQWDHAYLAANGISFHKVLQRSNECFDPLLEIVAGREMTMPTEQLEDEIAPPEDEDMESLAEPDWDDTTPDAPMAQDEAPADPDGSEKETGEES